MKRITIARDLGTSVDIETGLSPTDSIVDSPPDSLANGELVRPEQSATDMSDK
jgi:multidrug efflux system membrane fusion protein